MRGNPDLKIAKTPLHNSSFIIPSPFSPSPLSLLPSPVSESPVSESPQLNGLLHPPPDGHRYPQNSRGCLSS